MENASSLAPRILFVCLGNICRSPTAEGIARVKAPGLVIDSAGTGAWHIGNPPDGRMQHAAKTAGYDLSALRARQVTPADFERFDLIVAMDHENLADLERLRPSGNATPVRLMLSYLGRSDGVPDPYYEGGFDGVVALLEDAIDALLAASEKGDAVPL